MNALEISQLIKVYDSGVKALNGIDLAVAEGDFFALLGPNGAGKTTTIGIVTSLVRKTSGVVKVFEHDIDQELDQAKTCIGVVPQEFNANIFETPSVILRNQAGYYGIPAKTARPRIEKYLKQLDLWEKRDHISRTLSGGMKRRLMIARALVHEPKLLILDEPTAGVDIEIRRSMWKFLREINEQGTTIILTTHYLEEAENLCRNVAIIDGGRIIENGPMQGVLRKLQVESFVVDTASDLPQNLSLAPFATRSRNKRSFEIDVESKQSLNDLFQTLNGRGIEISGFRNKANRLEELFVRLVENQPKHQPEQPA